MPREQAALKSGDPPTPDFRPAQVIEAQHADLVRAIANDLAEDLARALKLHGSPHRQRSIQPAQEKRYAFTHTEAANLL